MPGRVHDVRPDHHRRSPTPFEDSRGASPHDPHPPWRRGYIARFWMVACLSRRCVNCPCGRSIELCDSEEVDVRDNYRLTSSTKSRPQFVGRPLSSSNPRKRFAMTRISRPQQPSDPATEDTLTGADNQRPGQVLPVQHRQDARGGRNIPRKVASRARRNSSRSPCTVHRHRRSSSGSATTTTIGSNA